MQSMIQRVLLAVCSIAAGLFVQRAIEALWYRQMDNCASYSVAVGMLAILVIALTVIDADEF